MLLQGLRADQGPQIVVDAGALQVFDSSALARFDSSALAVLLDARREAQALGRPFSVSGLPPRLRALAGLYGVSDLLPG